MKRTLILDDLTPVAAYAALRAASDGTPSFLLESAPTAGERWGRFSVIGFRPRRELTLDLAPKGREVRLRVVDVASGEVLRDRTAPSRAAIALLREAHAAYATPNATIDTGTPRVVDAAVGFLAYDLVHALEPVPAFDEPRRIAHLLDGATVVVFDALLQTVSIHGDDERAIDAAANALASHHVRLGARPSPRRDRRPTDVTTSIDDASFAELVARAQRYIGAGDVFQVVLARKFTTPRRGADPFEAYRALRVMNPSPYLYYVDLGSKRIEGVPIAIAGASPETLVRLEDGLITLRPLAGTRPRGRDEAHDLELERELLDDPKERAEHVMLVDLGRNDVGRVAKIGTVRVPVTMAIERYSHVMHIVSDVHGQLDPARDAWDVIGAAFPAGTLSGAPKVRAMQIIRELEEAPRGVYGGAIGYVSRHATLDMAIAIRTIVAYDDRFEVGAGAGVVEGSVPSLEAEETRHKAGASLAAVAAAQESA